MHISYARKAVGSHKHKWGGSPRRTVGYTHPLWPELCLVANVIRLLEHIINANRNQIQLGNDLPQDFHLLNRYILLTPGSQS